MAGPTAIGVIADAIAEATPALHPGTAAESIPDTVVFLLATAGLERHLWSDGLGGKLAVAVAVAGSARAAARAAVVQCGE